MQDTLADKYAALGEILVLHTRVKKILERIEQAHEMSRFSSEPECLLIYGNSGVGKSTLMKYYTSKYKRVATEEGVKVPVLKAIVPSPTSISSLVSVLLEQLGDPMWEKGTAPGKTSRLIKHIETSGVEIIFLDEFNHLVDSHERNKVSNWLKTLIEKTRVPVILFGLPYSELVLKSNVQLESRFSSRIPLDPFKWIDDNSKKEFRIFLKLVDKALPCEPIGLDKEEIAARIYYAGDGFCRGTMRLIMYAVYNAFKNNRSLISMDDLAKSYDQVLHSMYPQKLNPFRENFNLSKISENQYLDHIKRVHNPIQAFGNRIKKRKVNEEFITDYI